MFIRQHGTTLVELVMAIAVAGVLMVGLMTAYSSIAGRSADPMVRSQAISVAESYLEEALLKPFLDPSGSVCPASPGGNRENFNNVCDYHNYSNSSITRPDGTTITELNGYQVNIVVGAVSAGELNGVPTNCALKVTVNVTSPLKETVSLTGYRTDYESEPACS